ncbi:MAG TPA: hypothetical protein VG389_05300 [Myxococcota bacterium]|jgi:hypothetical protein|nr:hypothetical protein [Myxococcota bacterium]
MQSFLTAASGRLLLAALGLMTIGAAVSAALTEPGASLVFAVSTFVGVVMAIVALVLATHEAHTGATVLAIITLPFALFLYQIGAGALLATTPTATFFFAPVGMAALFLATVPRRRVTAGSGRTMHRPLRGTL